MTLLNGGFEPSRGHSSEYPEYDAGKDAAGSKKPANYFKLRDWTLVGVIGALEREHCTFETL